MSKKKYWYKFYYIECPVCGRTDGWKERQYTSKPRDASKRYVYNQVYDWCIESGLS